ncbi:uncharacterized protein G2W53_021704 [Senna tora]|uniref:Uncharacterized protein n=1 Tax=Senna tora TaxID=362788 RepID=A0A834TKP3_9FABA|nr:uncharacterized protein G2W53_021704 [Senna tora]
MEVHHTDAISEHEKRMNLFPNGEIRSSNIIKSGIVGLQKNRGWSSEGEELKRMKVEG